MSLKRLAATFLTAFAIAAISPAKTFATEEADRTPAAKKVVATDDDEVSNRRSHGTNGDFVNVRVAPIGLLIGYINIDVDFKVSREWTVGPTVTYWKYNFDSVYYTGGKLQGETRSIGARGIWSKNGAYHDGLYITPMIQFMSAKVTGTSVSTGREVTGTASVPILTGLVGYQWFWDNFNLNLGAGFSVGAASTKVDVNDGTTTSSVESSRSSGLALDFTLGWVF